MALFGCKELINIGGMAWMIWMQWHGGQCRYLLYDMDMEQRVGNATGFVCFKGTESFVNSLKC